MMTIKNNDNKHPSIQIYDPDQNNNFTIFAILNKPLDYYHQNQLIPYIQNDHYDKLIDRIYVKSKIKKDLSKYKIDPTDFKYWEDAIKVKTLIVKLNLLFLDCKENKISVRLDNLSNFDYHFQNKKEKNVPILVWNDGIGFGLNLIREKFEELRDYYDLILNSF